MPIYEFICRSCGCRFEALVGLGKENSVRCDSCRSADIRKRLSSFGIGGGGRLKAASTGCSTCSSHSCSTCK